MLPFNSWPHLKSNSSFQPNKRKKARSRVCSERFLRSTPRNKSTLELDLKEGKQVKVTAPKRWTCVSEQLIDFVGSTNLPQSFLVSAASAGSQFRVHRGIAACFVEQLSGLRLYHPKLLSSNYDAPQLSRLFTWCTWPCFYPSCRSFIYIDMNVEKILIFRFIFCSCRSWEFSPSSKYQSPSTLTNRSSTSQIIHCRRPSLWPL